MKKVTVFGKPGGGKSTLSRDLSTVTGISLWPLDLIEYKKNGDKVPREEYLRRHADMINSDSWIIEGLGTLDSFWARLDSADTIIYVDLPYSVHYWWVTKRLLKGLFIRPEGWPDGSSVLKGTIRGWKYLRLSPKFWTEELFDEIKLRGRGKDIYRISSVRELNNFVEKLNHSIAYK